MRESRAWSLYKILVLLGFCFYALTAVAEDADDEEEEKEEKVEKKVYQCKEVKDVQHDFREETIVKESTFTKENGEKIAYTATTGTLFYQSQDCKVKGKVFYIAYTKKKKEDYRPVTFCFNGGPGSSSVWLHLGIFGPKKVVFDKDGLGVAVPHRLENNPYSILDITDLVFIDPIPTGHSKPAPQEEVKQFQGVEEDVTCVAEFIRKYITKNERWLSPKFIAGESYGTARAACLAEHLKESHFLNVNGLLLISPALDFQTFALGLKSENDLSSVLLFPSFVATAWHHKMLPKDLQKQNLEEVLTQAEKFAFNEYSLGLLFGSMLDKKQKNSLIEDFSRYTGLSKEYVTYSDMRIHTLRFAKELLRSKDGYIVGRFDSRVKGRPLSLWGETIDGDPSFEAVLGGFTATFNQYLRKDLGWEKDEEYVILANVSPWNYGKMGNNKYFNVTSHLKTVLLQNPYLHIYSASGYFDLATPYLSSIYFFSHLGIPDSLLSRVSLKFYAGGHMMYSNYEILKKMRKDLDSFFTKALDKIHQHKDDEEEDED